MPKPALRKRSDGIGQGTLVGIVWSGLLLFTFPKLFCWFAAVLKLSRDGVCALASTEKRQLLLDANFVRGLLREREVAQIRAVSAIAAD